jgi:hypothetical protein
MGEKKKTIAGGKPPPVIALKNSHSDIGLLRPRSVFYAERS